MCEIIFQNFNIAKIHAKKLKEKTCKKPLTFYLGYVII